MSSTSSSGPSWVTQPGGSRRQRPGLAVTSAWVILAVGSLIGLTVWGEYDAHAGTGLFTVDVVAGVLSCGLLPVLVRWPVPGALALAVLAAVSPAATPPATVGTLHVALNRRFAVAVAVGLAGIVAHVVRGLWRPLGGLSFTWWVVLVILGHAALVGWGALVQARRSAFNGKQPGSLHALFTDATSGVATYAANRSLHLVWRLQHVLIPPQGQVRSAM